MFYVVFLCWCHKLEQFDDSADESEEGAVISGQNRGTCNEEALQLSLSSGCYSEFLRIEGPQNLLDPHTNIPWTVYFCYGQSPCLM